MIIAGAAFKNHRNLRKQYTTLSLAAAKDNELERTFTLKEPQNNTEAFSKWFKYVLLNSYLVLYQVLVHLGEP